AGWWFVRNWQLYGDPLGLAVFQAEFATQPFEARHWQAWLAALSLLHDSFWARFGWMNVPAPAWAIGVFIAVEIAVLAGLVWRWRSDDWSLRTWRLWWPLAAFALLALAWVTAFAMSAGLVAWQGRLLFPALPAIAITLAAGIAALWNAVLPGRDGPRRVLAPAGAGLLAVLALWMPFGVIQPAYPPQTVPEAVALADIGTPVYGRFAARQDERGAELRGVDVSGIPKAGETLHVTLWWHALGRQNRPWQVFIHLVDAEDTILAEDNREPRDGQFRMPLWSQGDWIKDTHPLVMPDLAPGTYRIRVGLWYPITGGRAGLFDKRDKLRGEYLDAATIIISR
ncbi:MAG TPA: hypothetical protein VFT99_20765, partial [Roseiflexaceae bacterium]|nr:hypothetical protein [Roseiflexaceae bacterium]